MTSSSLASSYAPPLTMFLSPSASSSVRTPLYLSPGEMRTMLATQADADEAYELMVDNPRLLDNFLRFQSLDKVIQKLEKTIEETKKNEKRCLQCVKN